MRWGQPGDLLPDVASSHGQSAAGLANGVLLRSEVDRVTGQLSDTRKRFLGTRAPKLFAVTVRGARSMLALSSRPWLVRTAACPRLERPGATCIRKHRTCHSEAMLRLLSHWRSCSVLGTYDRQSHQTFAKPTSEVPFGPCVEGSTKVIGS